MNRSKHDVPRKIRQLRKLIEDEKYARGLTIAEECVRELPDHIESHIGLAICQANSGRLRRALETLRTAKGKFPQNVMLLYHYGTFLTRDGMFLEAEREYHAAIAASKFLPEPESPDAVFWRSETHNGLGITLWEQGRKDDALAQWREALRINPNNANAQANLDENSNQYGEPVSPSTTFDDVWHFEKIHTAKYLAERGREMLDSEAEAQKVFGAIFAAWNDHFAGRMDELSAMTPAEKTALFESVAVDYSLDPEWTDHGLSKDLPEGSLADEFDADDPAEEEELDRAYEELLAEFSPEERAAFEEIDKRYPYLKRGMGMLMVYAGPPLIATGMSIERYGALLEGAEPTDLEIDLLWWAVDIARSVMIAVMEAGEPEEIQYLAYAFMDASEELEDDAAAFVVREMMRFIADGMITSPARKPVRRGKKRKPR